MKRRSYSTTKTRENDDFILGEQRRQRILRNKRKKRLIVATEQLLALGLFILGTFYLLALQHGHAHFLHHDASSRRTRQRKTTRRTAITKEAQQDYYKNFTRYNQQRFIVFMGRHKGQGEGNTMAGLLAAHVY